MLQGKGDYLYRTGNRWCLATKTEHKPVHLITLRPADDTWPVPDDRRKAYVFVFQLRRADLTELLGERVVNYLLACQTRNVSYKVARPIPPEILPAGLTLADLRIPSGCDHCLELFRLDADGDTLLCDGARLESFRFVRSGRPQVYCYLKLLHGDEPAKLANGEHSTLRLLRSFACTERPANAKPADRPFNFPAYWVSKVGWRESAILAHFIEDFGHRLAGGPVLDNGGGHGKDSFFLKEQGFEPVLIDHNANLLRFAERRRDETGLRFPIVRCDARSLPFADSTFSGVFSGGVMHDSMTQEGVQRYMDESSRLLRPDGLFFGNVWAHWDGKRPDSLLLLESQEVFEAMLRRAGLRPVEPIETRHTIFEKHKHMWRFVCEKVAV